MFQILTSYATSLSTITLNKTKDEIETCMRTLEKAKNLMNKASRDENDNEIENNSSVIDMQNYTNQTMVS